MTDLVPENDRYIIRCRAAADRIASRSGWSDCERRNAHKLISKHAKELKSLHNSGLGCGIASAKVIRKRNRTFKTFAGRACGEFYNFDQQRKKGQKPKPITWKSFEANLAHNPLKTGKSDGAIFYRVAKASGGHRIITNPGPRARSAHYLLSQVVTAQGWTNACDYNSAERGTEKARLAIRDLIQKDGIYHFVVFDVENCFPSVRPQHLQTQLRLPSEVISVLFMQNASPSLYVGVKAKSARHGLPQGAPASGKIASALIGREIRQIGGVLATVTYMDDGVIGASGPSEANEVAKALSKRLEEKRGGPIRLKYAKVCDAREGFEFLGYWIKASGPDSGSEVSFWPSHSAKEKFKRKLYARLDKLEDSLDWDGAISVLDKYRPEWVKAFSLWKPTTEEFENFLGETESWVSDYLSGSTKKFIPSLAAKPDS
jgi:hypothetical protein